MTLIAKALDAYAMTKPTKFTDRMSTVGASEIGACIRKTYWIKNEGTPQGVPRDPEYVDGWGARQRGTVFEDRFWYPAMRAKFGPRLKYAGPYQKTFVRDYLSATPDGLITDLSDQEWKEIGAQPPEDPRLSQNCVMAECKTADPRTNLTTAKEHNVFQTQVQTGLVRELTIWKPTHSVLSYTDASFWSDVREFVIPFDEGIYEAAKLRAQTIMTSVGVDDEIPPEGWIAGGHECRYCPFTKPCGVQRRNLPYADEDKPVDPQFVAEITDMARQIKIAEARRDGSDERVRALQDSLKNRLREKGVRKVPGVVAWSSVKGRNGYDNKALQAAAIAAGVNIEEYATQGEPSDRLTIQIGADPQP